MMAERTEDPEPYLTNADAGRLLNVAPQTVKLLALRGELVIAARTVRGERLYRLADVQRCKKQREKR